MTTKAKLTSAASVGSRQTIGEIADALQENGHEHHLILEKKIEEIRAAIRRSVKLARTPEERDLVLSAMREIQLGRFDLASSILGNFVNNANRLKTDEASELAETVRAIGTLTYFQDKTASLKAYRESVKLDPSDVWGWVFLSRLERQLGDIDGAIKTGKRALMAAEESGDERDIALAHHDLSQLYADAALRESQSFQKVTKRMVQNDPGNAKLLYDLILSQIMRRVGENDERDVDDHNQIDYELIRWVGLLESSSANLHEDTRSKDELLRLAAAAVTALLDGEPGQVQSRSKDSVEFSRGLRVKAATLHSGWFERKLRLLTNGSPEHAVLLGACFGVAFWALVATVGLQLAPLGWALWAFVPVTGAGYLGGLASLLGRLSGFSRLDEFDPIFLFVVGLFKPLVGGIFAIFGVSVLRSGLLPLDGVTAFVIGLSDYQLWTAAFLLGFSERFTYDGGGRGEWLWGTRSARSRSRRSGHA